MLNEALHTRPTFGSQISQVTSTIASCSTNLGSPRWASRLRCQAPLSYFRCKRLTASQDAFKREAATSKSKSTEAFNMCLASATHMPRHHPCGPLIAVCNAQFVVGCLAGICVASCRRLSGILCDSVVQESCRSTRGPKTRSSKSKGLLLRLFERGHHARKTEMLEVGGAFSGNLSDSIRHYILSGFGPAPLL